MGVKGALSSSSPTPESQKGVPERRGVGWPAEATPATREPHRRALHAGRAETRPRTGPFRVQAHSQEPTGEVRAHLTHTGPHITTFPAWLRTVITPRQVHCQAERLVLFISTPLHPAPSCTSVSMTLLGREKAPQFIPWALCFLFLL